MTVFCWYRLKTDRVFNRWQFFAVVLTQHCSSVVSSKRRNDTIWRAPLLILRCADWEAEFLRSRR